MGGIFTAARLCAALRWIRRAHVPCKDQQLATKSVQLINGQANLWWWTNQHRTGKVVCWNADLSYLDVHHHLPSFWWYLTNPHSKPWNWGLDSGLTSLQRSLGESDAGLRTLWCLSIACLCLYKMCLLSKPQRTLKINWPTTGPVCVATLSCHNRNSG